MKQVEVMHRLRHRRSETASVKNFIIIAAVMIPKNVEEKILSDKGK